LATDLCSLQRTSFAVEVCCLQRIRFRCRMVLPAAKEFSLSNYGVCSESAFAAEITLSTANLCSLLKLCVYSELAFATQNCVVCSELAFAAESACSV
jgi:hypothetical protein